MGEAGKYQSTGIEHVVDCTSTTSSIGAPREAWVDLQAAHERCRVSLGRTGADYEQDWYYLQRGNRILPRAARGAPRARRELALGRYIVVPDVERDPLNYWPLDGYRTNPPGSIIAEIRSDEFGQFYRHDGRRISVPSRERPGSATILERGCRAVPALGLGPDAG